MRKDPPPAMPLAIPAPSPAAITMAARSDAVDRRDRHLDTLRVSESGPSPSPVRGTATCSLERSDLDARTAARDDRGHPRRRRHHRAPRARRRANRGGRVARAARATGPSPRASSTRGETYEQAACREVVEETGMTCRVARFIGTTEYLHRKGRQKVVAYFLMSELAGEFVPNSEVDELRWCTVAQAERLLTWDRDRDLLAARRSAARAARLGPPGAEPSATVGSARGERSRTWRHLDGRHLDDRRPVPRVHLLHRRRGRDGPAGPARVVARRLGADGERRVAAARPRRVDRRRPGPQRHAHRRGPARGDGDRPSSPRRRALARRRARARLGERRRRGGRPRRSRSPTPSSTGSTARWGCPRPVRTATPSRAARRATATLVALADLDPGVVAAIRRISEVAEHEARTLLTTLADHGIAEGTEVEVTSTTAAATRSRCAAGHGASSCRSRRRGGSGWSHRRR